MTPPRLFLCAALAAGLSACGASPATHYHTLSLPQAPAKSGGAERLVEVLPVVLPGRVDRAAVVLSGADGSLEVRDADRWAGPLAEELRAVIDDALWRTARAADVYAAPLPASALPQYRLAVRLERFDAVPGDAASVEATWTLRRLPKGASAACRAAVSEPLSAGSADAAAAALAAASRRLAEAMADSLTRLESGAPPCAAAR